MPVNCGGLPRELIGSELFGYACGAFTGADSQGRAGKLEAAEGGTLCLDEIGEMPLDLQPWLLRVLEDGVVYRIGSHQPHPVNVRLLSATHRDLAQACAEGGFRSDLFYRLAVLRLRIPPLLMMWSSWPSTLPARRRPAAAALPAGLIARPAGAQPGPAPPRHELRHLQREAMLTALHEHHGNISQTARALGIARSTLYARLARGDLSA